MSPAATSAMSCFFSAAVSVMMLSSNVTFTGPSASSFAPSARWAASTEREMSASDLSNACSCLHMLRMRALLSLDTSVAVLT